MGAQTAEDKRSLILGLVLGIGIPLLLLLLLAALACFCCCSRKKTISGEWVSWSHIQRYLQYVDGYMLDLNSLYLSLSFHQVFLICCPSTFRSSSTLRSTLTTPLCSTSPTLARVSLITSLLNRSAGIDNTGPVWFMQHQCRCTFVFKKKSQYDIIYIKQRLLTFCHVWKWKNTCKTNMERSVSKLCWIINSCEENNVYMQHSHQISTKLSVDMH